MAESLDRVTAALGDRYTILHEIGRGGMATVYLATDLKNERNVALKVLRSELSGTLDRDRFLAEISLAATLRHPHAMPMLATGKAGGYLYCTMPYVEGHSLRDRLERDGELAVPQAARILVEIAGALSAAHALGVVHFDIKPKNVLFFGGHALVTDFGIARAVDLATGAKRLSSVGVAVASPTYMAPEQAAADPGIDHRVDIYALGVVAYELLCGHPPFGGPAARVIVAHMTQAPQPLSQARPGTDPVLEAVVMKCLAKKPGDRYQTAAEVSAAFEPFAAPVSPDDA